MQKVIFKLGIHFLKVLRMRFSWRILPVLVVTSERTSFFFLLKNWFLPQKEQAFSYNKFTTFPTTLPLPELTPGLTAVASAYVHQFLTQTLPTSQVLDCTPTLPFRKRWNKPTASQEGIKYVPWHCWWHLKVPFSPQKCDSASQVSHKRLLT